MMLTLPILYNLHYPWIWNLDVMDVIKVLSYQDHYLSNNDFRLSALLLGTTHFINAARQIVATRYP